MENGEWRNEIENWKLEIGNWKLKIEKIAGLKIRIFIYAIQAIPKHSKHSKHLKPLTRNYQLYIINY